VIATASNRCTEKMGQCGVMRFSQFGKETRDKRLGIRIVRKTEGALEYDGVVVQYRAAPGSTGEMVREEVISSAGEIGEGNKGRQGVAKIGECSGEGGGGGAGGGGVVSGAGASGRRGGGIELVVVDEGRSGRGGRGGGERAGGARGASGARFRCRGHGGGS
jgi:hypothetical protein